MQALVAFFFRLPLFGFDGSGFILILSVVEANKNQKQITVNYSKSIKTSSLILFAM